MLTTPAEEFLPNSVPCGPRNTSTWAMSNRLNEGARPSTTPSATNDTACSAVWLNELVEMPRMLMRVSGLPGWP